MSSISFPLRRLSLAAAVVFATACGITGPNSQTGTVAFVPVEGGCWGIRVGEQMLEPINLAEEFRVDGLQVTFEAEARNDMASICMIGSIVELTSIEAVEP